MARDSEAGGAEADVVVGRARRKCQTGIVVLGAWRSFGFLEPRVGVL
jgi:hypothetical protein